MRNLWKVSRKCMAVVSFIVFCMASMTFVVYGQSESLQNSELTLYLSQESIDTTREIFYRAVENGLEIIMALQGVFCLLNPDCYWQAMR